MNKKIRIILNWLAVLAWFGVIYFFSSQPNLKSEFEPLIDLILRKIAHMAEFFVLTFLFFRALSEYRLSLRTLLLISFFLSLFSAGFDEWHQSFTDGRVPSVKDVLIDSLGALGFCFLRFFQK